MIPICHQSCCISLFLFALLQFFFQFHRLALMLILAQFMSHVMFVIYFNLKQGGIENQAGVSKILGNEPLNHHLFHTFPAPKWNRLQILFDSSQGYVSFVGPGMHEKHFETDIRFEFTVLLAASSCRKTLQ